MESDDSVSANKLYDFLYANFWDGSALVSPEAGLAFNLHFYRFVKSYIPPLRRGGWVYSLQTQGYWIRANWNLYKLTNDQKYTNAALVCSDRVMRSQRGDGSWEYPLREWKKYVSTVEMILYT